MSQMVKANNKIAEQIETGSIIADDYTERIAQFLKEGADSIRKESEQESAYITSRAREEYKQRLSRFLEKEVESIRKRVERDAENTIAGALEEKERILTEARIMAKSRAEDVINKVKIQAEQTVSMQANILKQRVGKITDENRDECKKRADLEAATIIDSAKEQAIQIITQAKERAKKQADAEKSEEVKRIMESARLESAEIIAQAKQAADKEAEKTASKIISLAQQKAAQIISKTMEKLKNGEEEELAKLMSKEKHKSERETADIFAEVEQETEQLIKKVIDDTNGRGEVVNEDNKVEDMEEIESFIETGGEVAEARKRETMPCDQMEDIIHTSQEQKAEKPMEVEEETANATLEGIHQLEEESPLYTSVAAPAEEDKLTETEVAESSETFIEAEDLESVNRRFKNLLPKVKEMELRLIEHNREAEAALERMKIEETGSDMVGQDDESLHTGEAGLEDESTLSTTEAAPAEQDKLAKAEVAESSDTFVKAKSLLVEETGSDIDGLDDESLYTGEVEIGLGLLVGIGVSAKLHKYLVNTPEIQLVRTLGNSVRGTIITVVLTKPLPLVEMLSLQIPEAQITSEPPGANGKKRKARRINIARKEADIIPMEDSQE